MSRRKQAKPRALKREDVDNLPDESTEDIDMQDINKINSDDKDISNTMEFDSNSGMDGTSLGTATPNISMTDLENSQESELNGGVSTTSSRSTDTPDDPSDGDGDLPFTVGVTDSTPYPCHFCDKAFPRQSYLKQHEQEHSKELLFLCHFCQKTFKHKRSRDRHVKLHTGDRRYKCTAESCDMAFSRSDHLKIHLQTHGNGKPFPCKTCTRGYKTEAALTAHKQTHKKGRGTRHHPDKHFKCLTCNALFAQSHQLQDHMVTHQNDGDATERTVHCNFCAENFSTPEQLRQHVDQNHVPETQGRCRICFQTFENLEDLMQHKKVHEISHKDHTQSPPIRDSSKSPQARPKHKVSDRIDATSDSDAPPPPKIRRPSKPRDSSSPFSNPRTTPEESTPFACEFCTKRFVDMRELQRHTLHAHSHFDASGQSSVYCILCNFSFTNSHSFMEHVRLRHGDAPDRRPNNSSRNSSPRLGPEPFNGAANRGLYQCNQCNTGFFSFEQFRHHMQGHFIEGPNDFKCHVCGEMSPSKSHHVAHIADHFRDPATEFRCQGCGMKFADPGQLQKHLLELHALQLFRCSVCNLEFQSKGEINAHFAAKHSNTSCVFRCKTCQVVSRSELEFQLHVKTMHMVQDLTYHCPLCSQSFPSEPELYVHFQMHRAFNCLYCSETFQLQFLLDRHVQEKHSASGPAFPREDVAQNLSLKGSPGKRQVHNLRTSASQKPGQTGLSLDCAYCPEACKSRTELENHMKSHKVSSSKHKCNICDELFPSAATLSEHKLSHLKVETHRSCVACHVSLESAEQFEAHLRQHNADGMPAPCVICRQTLMTEEDVQVHARHHLKVQDTCSCCRKTIPAQMMIINGTQDNHSFMCKDCFRSSERTDRFDESSLKFENSPELSNHKMTAHPQKLFNCIKCQLTFDSKEEVENHCQIHILKEGNDNKCRLCDKNFDSPSKLQCHLIEHSFQESSSYRCYLCNAVFTEPCLIQQHMLEHNSKNKSFRCEQCHLSFFFKAELDNHIPSHSDLSGNVTSDIAQTLTTQNSFPAHSKIHDKPKNDPFIGLRTLQPPPPCFLPTPITFFPGLDVKNECYECKMKFAHPSDLHKHVWTHRKPPLPCRTCSKVYYSKEALARHEKRHLTFPCRYCEKRFAEEEEVTEHMRLHITSTTSPCEMCPETFESTSQLKQHLVAAHGKRFDHCCTVCSEAFESSELLERHVHKEHRESPSPETSESLSSDTKDSCSSNLEASDSSPLSVDANLETTHAVSQTVV